MQIVIISTCLKMKKTGGRSRADFHFNGFYNGRKITGIVINYDAKKHKVRRGKDYIIQLKVESEHDGILTGQVERLRSLDDIRRVF